MIAIGILAAYLNTERLTKKAGQSPEPVFIAYRRWFRLHRYEIDALHHRFGRDYGDISAAKHPLYM